MLPWKLDKFQFLSPRFAPGNFKGLVDSCRRATDGLLQAAATEGGIQMIDGVQVVESGNVVLLTFIGRQWGLRLQNINKAPSGSLAALRDGDASKLKQLLQNASTIEFKEQKIFPPFAACQRAIAGDLAVDLIYPKDSIDLSADAVIADFLQLFA